MPLVFLPQMMFHKHLTLRNQDVRFQRCNLLITCKFLAPIIFTLANNMPIGSDMSEIQQSDSMETLYSALLFSIRHNLPRIAACFFSPKETESLLHDNGQNFSKKHKFVQNAQRCFRIFSATLRGIPFTESNLSKLASRIASIEPKCRSSACFRFGPRFGISSSTDSLSDFCRSRR